MEVFSGNRKKSLEMMNPIGKRKENSLNPSEKTTISISLLICNDKIFEIFIISIKSNLI